MSKFTVKHTWNNFGRVMVKTDDDVIEIGNKWYFAVKREDARKAFSLLKSYGFDFKADKAFPGFVKIYAEDQWHGREKVVDKYQIVMLLEDKGIETFEGDLTPDKRWYVDNDIEISSNYKKLYFDIETHDEIRKIEIGRDMILSFAAIDSDGKKFFATVAELTEEEEKKLLIKFLKLIKRYDLILGWNSSGFDVPYLKMRMKKYDLHKSKHYCWKEVGHFDLLKRFRHIFRFDSHLKSFSLNFIANHFLGKQKVDRQDLIHKLWADDQATLKKYNIQDALLVKELDEKLGVSKMMILQSSWCLVPATQFGLYSIIDSHIIRTAHRVGKFVKTSVNAIKERNWDNKRGNENPGDTETDKAKYSGAIVLDPKIGIYDKVYVFDFKGLYPSMMRTSNIGYDTLRYEANDSYITNPGTHQIKRMAGDIKPTFFEKEPSIINLAISQLISKRNEYKKLKLKMIEEGTNKGPQWESVVSDEIIVKELSNSTYGIMGLSYGRYFSVDVAESITLFGQWCITFAKAFFERQGFNVIYGDTDSVFVSTGDKTIDPDKYLKLFHVELKNTLKLQYNIEESFIELNFDKEYDRFMLIEKKTYVGHVVNIEGKKTDDIYARGLDYHKKNVFANAGVLQKTLIDTFLTQKYEKNLIEEWCKKIKKDFMAQEFTRDDLTITMRVGKDPDDYKKTPPLHVRLAKKIKDETGEELTGHEIEYIVTSSGKIMDGVLAKDFTGEYDRQYYWSNKTQPLMDRILNVVYPGEDFFRDQLTLF